MSESKALIVLAKNLVYGKVKTRLAATIGDSAAFAVYEKLLTHTQKVTSHLPCDKFLFNSDFIDDENPWEAYIKTIQTGQSIGERMKNAFEQIFEKSYKQVVIIGTDCPELTADAILIAFEKLNNYDVVIGPASDGGYYLMGLKKLYPDLFQNISWSTSAVLSTTVTICKNLSLKYILLKELHDVDEEKDLKYLDEKQ